MDGDAGGRSGRTPPRHNSNFIAGSGCARAPPRRRRIYGQFFLLIFITSTCERGIATKRAFPRSPSNPRVIHCSSLSTGTRGFAGNRSLSTRWNGMFSSAFRDPYADRTTQIISERRFRWFSKALIEQTVVKLKKMAIVANDH